MSHNYEVTLVNGEKYLVNNVAVIIHSAEDNLLIFKDIYDNVGGCFNFSIVLCYVMKG